VVISVRGERFSRVAILPSLLLSFAFLPVTGGGMPLENGFGHESVVQHHEDKRLVLCERGRSGNGNMTMILPFVNLAIE
jgi:hypothetical protein